MATRYLVATGNWNSTSVWSASSGGSSGASVPTSSDDVYSPSSSSLTLTLTADAACRHLIWYRGTLNTSGYKLATSTIGVYEPGGTIPSATFNFGSSQIIARSVSFNRANFTLNADTSLISFSGLFPSEDFEFGNKTYNDVLVNLDWSGGSTINITGSPTFRSLIIQSKNSAAHTVTFDYRLITNKFVAIGSSIPNRLSINYSGDLSGFIYINDTSYGQFVSIGSGVQAGDPLGSTGKAYIGSNSISSGNYFTLQDPPKISTLVDPLTIAPGSNTNWTVTGTVTKVTSGHDGGGYKVAGQAPL